MRLVNLSQIIVQNMKIKTTQNISQLFSKGALAKYLDLHSASRISDEENIPFLDVLKFLYRNVQIMEYYFKYVGNIPWCLLLPSSANSFILQHFKLLLCLYVFRL